MKTTTKQGDLVGFNVKCVAPNGHTEWQHIREQDSGELLRLVAVVRDVFEPLGWTTTAYQVLAR